MKETIDWIDVNDRLPEEGKPVLLFTSPNRQIEIGCHDEDDGFYSDNGMIDEDDVVTFWAPLPAGPSPLNQDGKEQP